MKTTRKTGQDYRKEYESLKQSQKSLETHIDKRLIDLISLYPEAKIADDIQAKDIRGYVSSVFNTDLKIQFIISIEKWNDERQNIRQLEINSQWNK